MPFAMAALGSMIAFSGTVGVMNGRWTMPSATFLPSRAAPRSSRKVESASLRERSPESTLTGSVVAPLVLLPTSVAEVGTSAWLRPWPVLPGSMRSERSPRSARSNSSS